MLTAMSALLASITVVLAVAVLLLVLGSVEVEVTVAVSVMTVPSAVPEFTSRFTVKVVD